MADTPPMQPPGWYHAQGDPAGTQRYWDGTRWQGGPQPVPGASLPGDGSTAVEPQKRILARVIDGLIWAVIGVGFSTLVATIGGGGVLISLLAFVLGHVLVVTYEVVMTHQVGATVGKLAFGLRVVGEDGSPATIELMLRRMGLYVVVALVGILPLVGWLLFVFVGVGGLVMLFTDPRQQTPWDKVGRTLVVEP